MILIALALAAAPAPAGEDAELAAVRAALPAAVQSTFPDYEHGPEDLASWKARLERLVDLWALFRDSRCDERLLRFQSDGERPLACRRRITRVIVADLRFRFDLGPGGRARASIEATATRPAAAADAGEAGPCAHALAAECDYCGMNRCWDRRLKADDSDLNDAWRAALARIETSPGLSAAQRADWTNRLRASQRAWLGWREEACELEAWETPNPYAHSIYALVTGPCLDSETRARTAVLRRTYGR